MTKKALRAQHVNNEALQDRVEWAQEIPYDIRDEAMNDLLKALKATRAKKNGKKYEFKFRSKKAESQSITVLKKHWGHKRGLYADLFKSHALYGHEALPSTLEHHSRLVRTRLGHYYLCVPKPLDIRGESQAPPEQKHATIALDPGVRTFMTGYDADGAVYESGAKQIWAESTGSAIH